MAIKNKNKLHFTFDFIKVLFVILSFSGCSSWLTSRDPFPTKYIQDIPMTDKESNWLKGGEQSLITPVISDEALKIGGLNRRERLYQAKAYIWRTFSYDRWNNSIAFQKTADELFQIKSLGGCSDFALVELAFYRAVGIPSRLIITANVDWMIQHHQDSLALTEGHCFIEVYLEDQWYLVDPTYRWLFEEYRPGSPYYPHGEYFLMRGRDFWDMGIRTVQDFNLALRDLAERYNGVYHHPSYPKNPL